MESPILLAMLLLTVCVAGVVSRNCPAEPVCLTRACVSVASEMLESLDASADACEDFHQYACGGWLERQFLEQDRSRWLSLLTRKPYTDTRNILAERPKPADIDAVRRAKTLYASCVNHRPGATEDAMIVNAVTERFGRWPLTCNDCEVTGFDLETFLSKAIRLGVHPLFKLGANLMNLVLQPGERDGPRYLEVDKPELGIPRPITNPIHRQIYADKIYADAKRFGIDDHERAKQDAMEIVLVESTLAELHTTLTTAGSEKDVTLEYLDENYGQLLNWTNFVTTLAASPDIGITDISVNQSLYVHVPAYLSNMTTYFMQLPVRTQVNYLTWRTVDSLQRPLSDDNTNFLEIVEHAVNDTEAEPFRDYDCSVYVANNLRLVAHRMLYGGHLPYEKLQTVKPILRHLQEELIAIVTEHDWLDENTTKAINEKVDYTKFIIAFYDKAMNTSFVEWYYSNLTLEQDNFISNVIEVRQDAFAKNLRSIRIIDGIETTLYEPQLFVGHTYPGLNAIEFTSVLVQPPMYVDDAPMSINYAGLGFYISHELLHTICTFGRLFDKVGINRVWWSNESIINFENRTKCMVEQYSKFFYKPARRQVDGEQTLRENIADNGALKLVYRAYLNYTRSRTHAEPTLPGIHFPNERVFFLRYAQQWCAKETLAGAKYVMNYHPHSPGEFRIVGALQNSHPFAEKFGCRKGSRMNPVEKCEVW